MKEDGAVFDRGSDVRVNVSDGPGFVAEVDRELEFIQSFQDIFDIQESQHPRFALAKNRARFVRMLSWYKNKGTWLDVAPLSRVNRLFKQQTRELEGIRANKLDYEMELEMGSLTPSQKAYRYDELKMCKVHEKMAVCLISKIQDKLKRVAMREA